MCSIKLTTSNFIRKKDGYKLCFNLYIWVRIGSPAEVPPVPLRLDLAPPPPPPSRSDSAGGSF
ncbi:hypothetical protein M6B38_248255 [Iris pallida]|uniref:Uncharacterized protein n=1 Tax=Iris pallida TaxID=29817 RepID=A0AAX6DGJ6_IRIPA|nr:hypothetical protein M6B38_248255 [Iris pallida]